MKLISAIALILAMAMPASAVQLKTIAAFDASIRRGTLLKQGSSFFTADNGFTRHRPTMYNSMQIDTFACSQVLINKLVRNFNAVLLTISAKQRLFCSKPARVRAYASLLDRNSSIAMLTPNASIYPQQMPINVAGNNAFSRTESTATLLFDGNVLVASRGGTSFIKAKTFLALERNKYAKVDMQGNISGPHAIQEPYLVLGKKISRNIWQICSAKDNEIVIAGRSMQWCNLGKIGDEAIVINPSGEIAKYYIERDL